VAPGEGHPAARLGQLTTLALAEPRRPGGGVPLTRGHTAVADLLARLVQLERVLDGGTAGPATRGARAELAAVAEVLAALADDRVPPAGLTGAVERHAETVASRHAELLAARAAELRAGETATDTRERLLLTAPLRAAVRAVVDDVAELSAALAPGR